VQAVSRRITLKRAFSDGTIAVDMDPISRSRFRTALRTVQRLIGSSHSFTQTRLVEPCRSQILALSRHDGGVIARSPRVAQGLIGRDRATSALRPGEASTEPAPSDVGGSADEVSRGKHVKVRPRGIFCSPSLVSRCMTLGDVSDIETVRKAELLLEASRGTARSLVPTFPLVFVYAPLLEQTGFVSSAPSR
jgi:hypothetical protein